MRWLVLFTGVMTSLTTWGMTLEQSVIRALDNSPEVIAQYSRYQSLIREKDASFGDYLPQVNVYGAIGQEQVWYNNDANLDQDSTRSELGLKVSQLLFDGFGTSSDVARLGKEVEAERLTLISRAENVALDVVRTYLELLKAQTVVELSERNVREHEAIYADIAQKKEKGLSSNSDLAQVAARVATAKTTYLSAVNNYDDLRVSYRRLVGEPVGELFPPQVDSALLPASLDKAKQNAQKNHPEIKASLADVEAAREETRRERGNYYPEVRLELSANKNDNVGGPFGRDEDARVMLVVDYDIFSGLSTNADVEASAWRAEEARAIRIRTERQVSEGTEFAWNAFQSLTQQEQLLKQNVDAARIAEEGYTQQFSVGRRSLLDVLDSKIEVFLARRNYISTQYDRSYASYRLLNAMGMLTYALRIEQPDEWKEQQ